MQNEESHFAHDNAHPDLAVLKGGVAIVTGGASGIGLALSEKSLRQGMHCVVADIDEGAIEHTERELSSLASEHGVRVLGVPTDVSMSSDIDKLSDAVSNNFPDSPHFIAVLQCGSGCRWEHIGSTRHRLAVRAGRKFDGRCLLHP